jgi:hypothetical protein
MENLLEWLQNVYADDFCDGSWEHEYGLTLTNIDNPGWDFKFDLKDTDIVDIPYEDLLVENDKYDWYHCRIKDRRFEGWGGAKNLTDILLEFKKWYTKASAIADKRNADNIE